MSGILPEAASTAAQRTDALFWTIAGVVAFFAILVFALLIAFCVRYRRREGAGPAVQIGSSTALEVLWTAVPLAISLVLFWRGATLYADQRRTPSGSMQVYVVAKQWMWKLEHPEGIREIDELHVPVGRPVSLLMTSEDVIHSFFVPALRLKMDVVPGQYTTAWFEANRAGEYVFECSQYCGAEHAAMGGRVVVMEPQDFAAWLAAHAVARPLAESGAELFRVCRCDSCHAGADTERGPALAGLADTRVRLRDGRDVVADAAYLRTSILRPAADVVAGWPDVMPSYEGRLGEEQVLQLVAYVQSLAKAAGR